VALHHRLRPSGRPGRQHDAPSYRRPLPPVHNIERSGEDHYRISLAVAGFGADDIAVTAEHNALTIEGRKPEKAAGEFLYLGIAARPFRRVFNLADYVQVKEASFRDGLLIIDLVREVPEAMKPRRIQIAGGSSPAQIEKKAA
jgi:molecular chaperone IbpA